MLTGHGRTRAYLNR